jgi:hypothetical protein
MQQGRPKILYSEETTHERKQQQQQMSWKIEKRRNACSRSHLFFPFKGRKSKANVRSYTESPKIREREERKRRKKRKRGTFPPRTHRNSGKGKPVCRMHCSTEVKNFSKLLSKNHFHGKVIQGEKARFSPVVSERKN